MGIVSRDGRKARKVFENVTQRRKHCRITFLTFQAIFQPQILFAS